MLFVDATQLTLASHSLETINILQTSYTIVISMVIFDLGQHIQTNTETKHMDEHLAKLAPCLAPL